MLVDSLVALVYTCAAHVRPPVETQEVYEL